MTTPTPSPQEPAKRSGRIYVLWGIGLPLLLAVLAACLLRFGNPQWSKHIYIVQACYWPGHKDGMITPPGSYEGSWMAWHRNGAKRYEGRFVAGGLAGVEREWDESGQLLHERCGNNGKIAWELEYRDGRAWEGSRPDKDGKFWFYRRGMAIGAKLTPGTLR